MSASEKTPPAVVHTDDRAERKWPHLIVLHGAGVGEVHRVIGREAVVGRDLGCDVRIEHPTVSRRHARLIVAGQRVFIEDLGSTNGTLVGLNTVRGRRMVPDGAVVALGSVTLLKLTYSAILDDVLRRADYQSATTDPQLASRASSICVISSGPSVPTPADITSRSRSSPSARTSSTLAPIGRRRTP